VAGVLKTRAGSSRRQGSRRAPHHKPLGATQAARPWGFPRAGRRGRRRWGCRWVGCCQGGGRAMRGGGTPPTPETYKRGPEKPDPASLRMETPTTLRHWVGWDQDKDGDRKGGAARPEAGGRGAGPGAAAAARGRRGRRGLAGARGTTRRRRDWFGEAGGGTGSPLGCLNFEEAFVAACFCFWMGCSNGVDKRVQARAAGQIFSWGVRLGPPRPSRWAKTGVPCRGPGAAAPRGGGAVGMGAGGCAGCTAPGPQRGVVSAQGGGAS